MASSELTVFHPVPVVLVHMGRHPIKRLKAGPMIKRRPVEEQQSTESTIAVREVTTTIGTDLVGLVIVQTRITIEIPVVITTVLFATNLVITPQTVETSTASAAVNGDTECDIVIGAIVIAVQ